MSLTLQINDDLKNAMKAKEEAKLSTLRMLKSALKNKQIDLYGAEAKELSDEEIMAVVKMQIKQLKDAADTFKQGGRADMAESSTAEISILEKYLPAQMDDAALASTVKEALTAAGMTSKADAGKAMGVAMKAVAGKADAGRVKKVVETILTVFVVGVLFHALVPTIAFAQTPTSFSPIPFIAYGLRVARAFLLIAGLVAVNQLLAGSFAYMVSAGNEDTAHHAHSQMNNGFLFTIIIAGLFASLTVSLHQLAAFVS